MQHMLVALWKNTVKYNCFESLYLTTCEWDVTITRNVKHNKIIRQHRQRAGFLQIWTLPHTSNGSQVMTGYYFCLRHCFSFLGGKSFVSYCNPVVALSKWVAKIDKIIEFPTNSWALLTLLTSFSSSFGSWPTQAPKFSGTNVLTVSCFWQKTILIIIGTTADKS